MHFGVVMIMNLSIGTFTPPFGINIFVGQAVFKAPCRRVYPGLMPFIVAALVALAVVTYVPQPSPVILPCSNERPRASPLNPSTSTPTGIRRPGWTCCRATAG